jgi:hypothetical protein
MRGFKVLGMTGHHHDFLWMHTQQFGCIVPGREAIPCQVEVIDFRIVQAGYFVLFK